MNTILKTPGSRFHRTSWIWRETTNQEMLGTTSCLAYPAKAGHPLAGGARVEGLGGPSTRGEGGGPWCVGETRRRGKKWGGCLPRLLTPRPGPAPPEPAGGSLRSWDSPGASRWRWPAREERRAVSWPTPVRWEPWVSGCPCNWAVSPGVLLTTELDRGQVRMGCLLFWEPEHFREGKSWGNKLASCWSHDPAGPCVPSPTQLLSYRRKDDSGFRWSQGAGRRKWH